MKLATWNVNSVKIRAPAAAAWLAEHQPDVLLLQELKCETAAFPADVFRAAGYEHLHATGQKSYNGVAVVAKRKFDLISDSLSPSPQPSPARGEGVFNAANNFSPPLAGGDTGCAGPLVRHKDGGEGEKDNQARYQEVCINGLHIINIYAPNGNPLGTEKFSYKLAWLARLQTRLEQLTRENKSFIVMGDFNIIPEAQDCYDPAAWQGDALFQPQSRAAYRSMINLGLTDAIRMFYPTEHLYTFWDYQGGAWQRNNGIRIDHILMSPAVADRCIGAGIDKEPRGREQPSDHVPVWVELR